MIDERNKSSEHIKDEDATQDVVVSDDELPERASTPETESDMDINEVGTPSTGRKVYKLLRTYIPPAILLVLAEVLAPIYVDGYTPAYGIGFAAIFAVGFFVSHFKLGYEPKHPRLWDAVLVVLAALFCFLMAEVAYLPEIKQVLFYDGNLRLRQCLMNIVIILVFMLLASLLLRRLKRGCQLIFGLIAALSFINACVYAMRQTDFGPDDILNISTGLSLAQGNLGVTHPPGLLLAIGLLYLGVAFTSRIVQKPKPFLEGKSTGKRVLGLIVRTVLVCILIVGALFGFRALFNKTSFFEGVFGYNDINWSPHRNLRHNGYIAVFTDKLCNMYVFAPGGYSKQACFDAIAEANGLEPGMNEEELLTALAPELAATSDVHPNIIIIQDESFADYESAFPDKGTYTEEVTPNVHAMMADPNVLTGRMRVGVHGGGTVTTEWEVISGTSSWYETSSAPYSDLAAPKTQTIVTRLKAQGYRCEYIHPSDGTDYNRNNGLPTIGFDMYWDETYFEGDDIYYGEWISDAAAYDLALQRIRETDEPIFIFDNTMQDHFPYETTSYPGDDTDYAQVKLEEFSDLDSFSIYLTLAHETDRALAEFLAQIDELDEPTIIIVYGDHQPRLYDDDLKDWLSTDAEGNTGIEVDQRSYETPLIIYSNYGLPGGDLGEISTNYLGSYVLRYAGLELSPYDTFLLNMYETVPVITKLAWELPDGVAHSWDEIENVKVEEGSDLAKVQALLRQYQYLQYNLLYDEGGYMPQLFMVPSAMEDAS